MTEQEPERLPIVQYWDKEQIPDYIAEHFATFRDLNPDLPHLVFNERSAAEFIGERFGPRHLRAFRACAVPAMQADYLRYCAILAMGGVYSDADQRCVQSLRPFMPPAGCGRLYRSPHGFVINGTFAFGSPGHLFLELALDIATFNLEGGLSSDSYSPAGRAIFFMTGPAIFTGLIRLHRAGSFDAFRAEATGQAETVRRSYCDAIGDFDRVRQALEGIEVIDHADGPIVGSGVRLPYKRTDPWGSFHGNILRSPDALRKGGRKQ